MHIARVLIADMAIPTGGTGSWSQRLEYLLQKYAGNTVDYLIAEPSNHPYNSGVTIRYECKQYKSRYLNKLWPTLRYKSYNNAISEILSKHEFAIICVMDSLRVKKHIWRYIKTNGLQARVKLAYYQCGFSKYLDAQDYERFAEGVSQCIYLTKNSYKFDLLNTPYMPFVVSILHNPINHQVFHPISSGEKEQIRQQLGMDNKIQFIWASYDRPKKGLEVILDAWLRYYTDDMPIVLNVVGVSRTNNIPGVQFHGKVNNAEMHKWFKAADISVFSSLWPEGFSLSLAEQVSCGLLCIASTAGCVAEYFIDGEHGIAIDEPNLSENWIKAFDAALLRLPAFVETVKERKNRPPHFLTYDEWCSRFQAIFDNMERRWLPELNSAKQ